MEVSDRFKTGKGPYNLEITPNGKLLIGTIKSEGKTAIWNLENKEELAIIKKYNKCFSRNCNFI